MNPRKRIALAVVVAATLAGLGGWAFLARDPLFRGQPESAWIQGLVYNGDDEQVQRWKS